MSFTVCIRSWFHTILGSPASFQSRWPQSISYRYITMYIMYIIMYRLSVRYIRYKMMIIFIVFYILISKSLETYVDDIKNCASCLSFLINFHLFISDDLLLCLPLSLFFSYTQFSLIFWSTYSVPQSVLGSQC